MSTRPGGKLARRPLHVIYVLDVSGSMKTDGKIQALNTAVEESLPQMRAAAALNPHAEVLCRAITFSNGAQWHVATPTPVDEFHWPSVAAGGETDMGKAFSLLADALKIPPMEERGLTPVLVLVSDGQPTDDFETARRTLMKLPWGLKATRIAIAIGRDANLEVLRKFIDNPELEPLQATSADSLKRYIKWASTVAIAQAASPVITVPSLEPIASAPVEPKRGNGSLPILTQAPDVSAATPRSPHNGEVVVPAGGDVVAEEAPLADPLTLW